MRYVSCLGTVCKDLPADPGRYVVVAAQMGLGSAVISIFIGWLVALASPVRGDYPLQVSYSIPAVPKIRLPRAVEDGWTHILWGGVTTLSAL